MPLPVHGTPDLTCRFECGYVPFTSLTFLTLNNKVVIFFARQSSLSHIPHQHVAAHTVPLYEPGQSFLLDCEHRVYWECGWPAKVRSMERSLWPN